MEEGDGKRVGKRMAEEGQKNVGRQDKEWAKSLLVFHQRQTGSHMASARIRLGVFCESAWPLKIVQQNEEK